MANHLIFNSDIGKAKPQVMRNPKLDCPFCDVERLTDILDLDGDIILLKNKYPVLQKTFQTVLIETADCHSELTLYSQEHLHKVIQFGLTHWLEYEKSGDFKSVLFFKNHGPLSGGTIRHPHMQIVGLEDIDYRDNLIDSDFEGLTIFKEKDLTLNISTKPRIGFFEFNILINSLNKMDRMADMIQLITSYLLNEFHAHCNSYNLFFYQYRHQIITKIVPRFPTSPIFVGYGIPQVSTAIERTKDYLKQRLQEKGLI